MSQKPYPKYKDSGVEWLGEIPIDWSTFPLWNLFKRTKRLGNGKEELLSVYRDYGVVPKSSRNDNFNKASEDLSKYQIVEIGDLVINKMKAWQGSVAVSEHNGIVSPAYFVFRALGKADSRFIHFLMRSTPYFQHYASISAGVRPNQWDLDPVRHRKMPVLFPSLSEQRYIAAYLDRETAEIDAFIADQEELIALLSERRTATITQAVTKGLDPKSRMKDSNVSNLGLIPAPWAVTGLKHFTLKITDGAHISPETDGGIYDFVSTRDVSDSGINFEGSLKTSPETYEYMVRTGCRPQNGDVLFSKDGTVGRTVVVQGNHDFVVASSLIIIRPDLSKLDPNFLNYLCRSAFVQEQVRSFVKGAGLPRLSIANLLRVTGVFPPLNEQQEIVDYLDRETTEIDAAIADAREAIALSKERRAAVISAAVTGKIDVRGLVAPATSNVEAESVGIA
ncbi:type I restriction-modification system specificity subunit (plasmid) [Glutamicibacter arilaitensis Re117]|uniref:Type I restriction-modification system specificity subunit n=1 Tax=Glutamicibacter arilaitensis (strain DSM 16368 / CIP 108037 / IAM 15318 / JCM 13566 / NCIMB 14258 / Re117) TaxID=861360 RepID=A0ABM9PSM1_GLUAR|nr:restriction endonuclease subunit S [Glutamicibacter arilaitensis]CBQ74047.1 type I restriction-modification system specificity subunit [Glutamicibacter arilaitensis Re117]